MGFDPHPLKSSKNPKPRPYFKILKQLTFKSRNDKKPLNSDNDLVYKAHQLEHPNILLVFQSVGLT